jgi:hypothetical protein
MKLRKKKKSHTTLKYKDKKMSDEKGKQKQPYQRLNTLDDHFAVGALARTDTAGSTRHRTARHA